MLGGVAGLVGRPDADRVRAEPGQRHVRGPGGEVAARTRVRRCPRPARRQRPRDAGAASGHPALAVRGGALHGHGRLPLGVRGDVRPLLRELDGQVRRRDVPARHRADLRRRGRVDVRDAHRDLPGAERHRPERHGRLELGPGERWAGRRPAVRRDADRDREQRVARRADDDRDRRPALTQRDDRALDRGGDRERRRGRHRHLDGHDAALLERHRWPRFRVIRDRADVELPGAAEHHGQGELGAAADRGRQRPGARPRGGGPLRGDRRSAGPEVDLDAVDGDDQQGAAARREHPGDAGRRDAAADDRPGLWGDDREIEPGHVSLSVDGSVGWTSYGAVRTGSRRSRRSRCR